MRCRADCESALGSHASEPDASSGGVGKPALPEIQKSQSNLEGFIDCLTPSEPYEKLASDDDESGYD